MHLEYDVLIAGAGPAGIACGITLQKIGIKCLIIDKAIFPRKKLCGGLLTSKAFKKIMELTNEKSDIVDSATMEVCRKVGIAKNNDILNTSEINVPIRIIDRTILDSNLVEYYKNIGGKIIEGEKYKNYDFENKVVNTDKNEYKVKYFVNATGSATKSENKNVGFCLETFIKKDDVPLSDNNTVIIDFGIINKGYLWIFPAGDYVKIGYGNLYNKKYDYRKNFLNYLQKIKVKNLEKYTIKGAFVPYGKCESKHFINDFCILLGDQAMMTDPLYGEGLYFAYKTGITLATELKHSFEIGSFNYERIIDGDKKQVNSGHILKTIFFNKLIQKVFVSIVKRKKKLIKFYVDEQVSEYKYKHSDILGLAFGYKRYKYE